MSAPSQLQQVVGRALIDAEFRKALLVDTRGTLAREGFHFDEMTLTAIESAMHDPEKVRSFTAAFQSEFLGRADYVC